MAAQEFTCAVKSHKMLTPTVFELTFEPNQPLNFKAGQFISIVVPGAGPGGRNLRRAYSIASPPDKLPIELCVKIVENGPGTNYLNGLRPGDEFKGFAPYGSFVYTTAPGRNVCFISTGTGIAPFRAMVLSKEFKNSPPKKVYSFFGVRSEDEVLYEREFVDLGCDCQWVSTISRPAGEWGGYKGRVTQYLQELDDSFPWKETDFYLCGNGDMIKEVKELLATKGVEKSALHIEKYY